MIMMSGYNLLIVQNVVWNLFAHGGERILLNAFMKIVVVIVGLGIFNHVILKDCYFKSNVFQ